MSKDDYYVIVYKILAYLYMQLKEGEGIDEKMLSCDSPLFRINERYWTYIMLHLTEEGYIDGIQLFPAMGGVLIGDLDNAVITPKGIAYLCENSLIEKAKHFLKDVKDITPFI